MHAGEISNCTCKHKTLISCEVMLNRITKYSSLIKLPGELGDIYRLQPIEDGPPAVGKRWKTSNAKWTTFLKRFRWSHYAASGSTYHISIVNHSFIHELISYCGSAIWVLKALLKWKHLYIDSINNWVHRL